MSDHITIRPATGTWSVRAGGAVIGESKNAIELIEGDLHPVIYFPKSDLAMAFLDQNRSNKHLPLQRKCNLLFHRHKIPNPCQYGVEL
jgi:uncharacterized protein (DUF427 family)